ncbi:hypothetical protein MuYL_1101 [Mucilaginibacter xinganensis]|uniref:Uncharacterized protein n=1 Tax=Mucilaginibacter xinganensis TaxID=1234841 RepID=A0A223NU18_9SPHI|nr:hypothetical protein MuYL_1101 [Mucilaginibacter xinganensis]
MFNKQGKLFKINPFKLKYFFLPPNNNNVYSLLWLNGLTTVLK